MTIPFSPPDTPKYGWRGPYRGYVRVQQLVNLRSHCDGLRWVYYTQCHLVKHRTDHLGGWYA